MLNADVNGAFNILRKSSVVSFETLYEFHQHSYRYIDVSK